MKARAFHLIFASVLLLAISWGCSGSSAPSGGGTSAKTDGELIATAGEGAPQREPEVYSEEQKKSLVRMYDRLPQNLMTQQDFLMKDYFEGKISEIVMKKQKICLYLGNECLLPQYRYKEGMASGFCGNPLMEEVRGYLAESPELKTFYDAVRGISTQTAEVEVVNAINKAPGTEVSVGISKYKSTEEPVSLPDTAYLPADEPFLELIKKLTEKIVAETDPQKFEIFFVRGRENDAKTVKAAIEAAYKSLRDGLFGGTDVIPYDYSGNPKVEYHIYIVESQNFSTFPGHLGYTYPSTSDDGKSYIVMLANRFTNALVEFERLKPPNIISRETKLRGAVIHELGHALEIAKLKGNVFNDKLMEALVEFGPDYVFHGENSEHRFLSSYLYKPDYSTFSKEPYAHEYGAYLLFSFVNHYFYEPATIVNYLNLLKGGKSFEVAYKALLGGEENYQETFHKFAISNLNLSPAPSGSVDYGAKDPGYDYLYLSWTDATALLPDSTALGEYRTTELISMAGLAASSTTYFTFTSPNRHGIFRKFEISVDGVGADAAKATAFYLRAPDEDQNTYQLLGEDKVPGRVEHCFKEQDIVPDVIIVAVSNADPSSDIPLASVRINGRPFCEGGRIKASRIEKPPTGKGPTIRTSLDAEMHYRPGGRYDCSNINGATFCAPILTKFHGQFGLNGDVTWNVSGTSDEVGPPENCQAQPCVPCTRITTYSGNNSINIWQNDLFFKLQTDSPDGKKALYQLESTPGGTPERKDIFKVAYQAETTCDGTCSDPCGGPPQVIDDVIRLPAVEGYYNNGDKVFTKAAGNDDQTTVQEWTVTFSEPASIRKMEPGMSLIYTDGPFKGLLKPPIIDSKTTN